MRCYHCAETIRAEANRCRFCGMEITSANRIGLPSWYRETGQCGLILLWIVRDLEEAATGDTGNVVLAGGDRAIRYAYGNRGDRDASERMFVLHEFIGDRLNEVHSRRGHELETAFLYPLMIYTMWLRSLLRYPEHWSPENISSIADRYEAYAVDEDQVLPPDLRSELFHLLKDAAEELRKIAKEQRALSLPHTTPVNRPSTVGSAPSLPPSPAPWWHRAPEKESHDLDLTQVIPWIVAGVITLIVILALV